MSWRWVLGGALAALLLLIVILATTAPLSKSLQPITAPSLTLVSADGVIIARRGAVVEEPVRVAALPDHVVQPFLAIEDRRFYSHLGVDPKGLARAALNNLKAGGVVEGGSTITQQLAKLSFLSSEQTIWRKMQEAVLAVWLEAWLSKDEILSRYLSSAYFGDNVYGLRAAAHHYFDREPNDLKVEQAALLAGLLKAPTSLAPTEHPQAARERAAVVIDAMVQAGMLTQKQAEALPAAKLELGEVKDVPTGTYFTDWVLSLNRDSLDGRAGTHRIVTTLEDRLQREAVSAIRSIGTRGAQVALVAMRRDGRVVAMVGGKSYRKSQFNRATQALRQPGSTFKLFVYLAALSKGYRPDDRIADRPLRIGDWTPSNYGNEYRGDITLREAFAVSSNVASVRLAEAVGRSEVRRVALNLGVDGKIESGPTMALGTSAVSLIDMVAAYAAVASGRYPIEATGLPEGGDDEDRTRRISPRVQRDMLKLLWSAANQGSGRAAVVNAATFGKTGTSQDGRDAYFIGFAGDLITGVWVGYDDNRPMPGAQGGGLPATIWRTFMSSAMQPVSRARVSPTPEKDIPPQPAHARTLAAPREYDVDEEVEPGVGAGPTVSSGTDQQDPLQNSLQGTGPGSSTQEDPSPTPADSEPHGIDQAIDVDLLEEQSEERPGSPVSDAEMAPTPR